MSDVVVGAVIGLMASLITTVVIKWLEWRRENAVRWDKDILTVATEGLIAAERAKGRIYAWSRGEYSADEGKARPEKVDDEIDKAYYKTKSLAILFPNTEAIIGVMQDEIGSLAALTGAYRADLTRDQGSDADRLTADYTAAADLIRTHIDELGSELLDAVQSRLRVDKG
jgi:hypothetical protein